MVQEENDENGQDPALRTISNVFKSLFNGNSAANITTVSPFAMANATAGGGVAQDRGENGGLFDTAGMQKFLEMLSSEIPAELLGQFGQMASNGTGDSNEPQASTSKGAASLDSPMGVLKLIEPLINEKLVLEIGTTYEFHINVESNGSNGSAPCTSYSASTASPSIEIYHLDLKTPPRGSIGKGPSLFSKADCVIKLSDRDLSDLLMDNLKPFTAYMSGRIEVDGNLQDVFRLKKLISTVTNTILAKTSKHFDSNFK